PARILEHRRNEPIRARSKYLRCHAVRSRANAFAECARAVARPQETCAVAEPLAKCGAMSTAPTDWPPSLWAAVTPAAPGLPVLRGAHSADVIVVGAGFTGLSTALHLVRAGIDVAV